MLMPILSQSVFEEISENNLGKVTSQSLAEVSEQQILLTHILCTFSFVRGRKPMHYYYDVDELQR